MVDLQACRPIAALFALTMLLSRVTAEDNATQNRTLPVNSTGHFDPAKYSFPLPNNSNHVLSEGMAANTTFRHNMTVNSTMPTAGHHNHQQGAKYILPLQLNTTGVGGKSEGASIESADTNSSASALASPSSASATIKSVPGFVKRQGQNFVVNGKAAYFAGTNAWCAHLSQS